MLALGLPHGRELLTVNEIPLYSGASRTLQRDEPVPGAGGEPFGLLPVAASDARSSARAPPTPARERGAAEAKPRDLCKVPPALWESSDHADPARGRVSMFAQSHCTADAGGSHGSTPKATLHGYHAIRPSQGESESTRPQLPGLEAERSLDERHHLCRDAPGLALCGNGDGPLYAKDHWACDAGRSVAGARDRCAATSHRTNEPNARGYDPLRSGCAVLVGCVSRHPARTRLPTKHEPERQLLG